MPKVSIIMNCLNGERFLKEAIDSIYSQTFTDWEIIFFDSGSIDKSVEIATSYGPKVKIYQLDKPVPLGQARQEAFDMARGDYVTCLDVDDIYLPFKLQMQYDAMKSGKYDVCYGGLQCIDETGKLLHKIMPIHSSGPMFEKQLFQLEGGWLNYMFNREKILSSGVKFNPTFRSSSEDDFIYRLLAINGTGVVLNKVISKYRICQSSVTSNYKSCWALERFSTLERLVNETPEIKDLFPEALKAAEARGYYYKACDLFDQNKYGEARESMSIATRMDKGYRLVSILIRSPILWRFAHRFKGYLAPLWLRFLNKNERSNTSTK